MKKTYFALITLFLSQNCLAENYSYPELQVRPSASQRLTLEAKSEKSHSISEHSHIAIPSLLTLSAGILAMNDPGNDSEDSDTKPTVQYAGMAGAASGLGWLAMTYYLSKNYHPYQGGLKDISKLPSGNKSQKLIKERLAEEHLRNAARVGRRVKWLSFSTNALTSLAIAGSSEKDMTKLAGGAGFISSGVSLMFNYVWNDVYCRHEEYKKRIYGPIASSSINFNQKTGMVEPELVVTMPF